MIENKNKKLEKGMTAAQARKIVEQEFDLDISKKTSIRRYVAARSVYFYIMKRYTKVSYVEFTKIIKYHHSIVVHCLKKLDDDLETEFWEYPLELTICSDRAMLLSSTQQALLMRNFKSISDLNKEFKTNLYALMSTYEKAIEAYESKIKLENLTVRTKITRSEK